MKRENNNLKFVVLVLAALVFVLAGATFVDSQNANVCCEKDSQGRWCQNVDSQSKCDTSGDLNYASTSCENTAFCQTGTCVDTNKGVCMPQTPKTRCESEGGTWKNKPKSQIDMCRNGCCVAGDQTAFTTSAQCKQIASDYGIDTNFRSEVTDEDQCLALAQPDERGACLTGGETNSTGCTMTTSDECSEQGGDFREGMLCSAPGLSDCTWTGQTQCSDDDVHFVDTCGNLANVYDEDMYSKNDNSWNQEMKDYWTFLQEPNETVTSPTSSFGNCDYQSGTICKEYSSGNQGMPNDAPEYGDNVCADLGCYYDVNKSDGQDEKYFQHGESWCAQSRGTYDGIPSAADMNNATRERLANPEKYNVPGSRYYQLKCWEGDVIKTACSDYRNEVCKETSVGGGEDGEGNFSTAQCVVNNWRECLEPEMQNEESCEADGADCKWVEGYRYDEEKTYEDESQGSCVPLFSPGFDFWKEDSEAQNICSGKGSVSQRAIFETPAVADSFLRFTTGQEGREDLEGSDEDYSARADRCIDGCASIPKYGKNPDTGEYYGVSKVKSLVEGSDGVDDATFLSNREGYYCKSSPGASNEYTSAKTGGEGGITSTQQEGVEEGIRCRSELTTRGDDQELGMRRDHIFYTHKQWLNSIQKRARLLGDCGVTSGVAGNSSNSGSEIVNQMFRKLNQDGTPKSGQNNTESKKVYEGDAQPK